jgi:hypothetical protein
MHVTIVNNQALSDLGSPTCAPGLTWTAGYDHPSAQIFTINVAAETTSEVGKTVGLTQTLLRSSRIARYAGGGQLQLDPGHPPPCLDGDHDRIPWYNQFCAGQRLPAVGHAPVRFEMNDVPGVNVPSTAHNTTTAPATAHVPHPVPTTTTHNITSLAVAETFLLSLIDHDDLNKVIKQWLWQYSYEFTNDTNNVFRRPTLGAHAGMKCQEQAHIQPPVLVGPVATQRNHANDRWGPAGWGPAS